MQRYLLIFFLSLPSFLFSQGHRVEVIISGLPDQKVYLSAFYKDQYFLEDSIRAINGSYYFFKDSTKPGGMYRMDFQPPGKLPSGNSEKFIEFIWTDESFQISAEYKQLAETVSFSNSLENTLLGEFREYENIYEQKVHSILAVLDQYPEIDSYYNLTIQEFSKLQQERDEFISKLHSRAPNSFASRLVVAYKNPEIPPGLGAEGRRKFMMENFYDEAMIDDPDLLRAPVYNRRIIEYLMLFRQRDYTFAEQEEAFTTAVDVIMANVSGDIDLRAFVVEYLLDGFESFGMEELQTYIVDTYIDETCSTDTVELAKQRVEAYRKMAVGETAADILIRSANNEMVRLSEQEADYVLILFWATYCPHCVSMIPELQDWYANERPAGLEIFAISIDTIKSEWQAYLEQNHLPWINAHEPMGWEGKSAEDYNVYATPTMFLIDRHRRIIARPFNIRELKRETRKLHELSK